MSDEPTPAGPPLGMCPKAQGYDPSGLPRIDSFACAGGCIIEVTPEGKQNGSTPTIVVCYHNVGEPDGQCHRIRLDVRQAKRFGVTLTSMALAMGIVMGIEDEKPSEVH